MSLTIGSMVPGHPVTVYTTRIQAAGGVATGNTTESEQWKCGANKWGQVGLQMTFYNESKKEIKYIDFKVVPFNSVRDVAGSIVAVRATGPFKGQKTKKCKWNYLWDGNAIKSAVVSSVKIYYMDGTEEEQSAMDINYDAAVSAGIAAPITLAVIMLAMWISGIYRSAMPSVGILFPLSVILSIGAMFLSRTFKNKLGTIICSAGAFVCGLLPVLPLLGIRIPALMRLPSNLYLYRGGYGRGSAQLLNVEFICTAIMLLLMLVCNLNLIKRYSTKQWLMIAALVIAIIVLVAYVFISISRYEMTDGDALLPLAYASLYWTMITFVVFRCRMHYPEN